RFDFQSFREYANVVGVIDFFINLARRVNRHLVIFLGFHIYCSIDLTDTSGLESEVECPTDEVLLEPCTEEPAALPSPAATNKNNPNDRRKILVFGDEYARNFRKVLELYIDKSRFTIESYVKPNIEFVMATKDIFTKTIPYGKDDFTKSEITEVFTMETDPGGSGNGASTMAMEMESKEQTIEELRAELEMVRQELSKKDDDKKTNERLMMIIEAQQRTVTDLTVKLDLLLKTQVPSHLNITNSSQTLPKNPSKDKAVNLKRPLNNSSDLSTDDDTLPDGFTKVKTSKTRRNKTDTTGFPPLPPPKSQSETSHSTASDSNKQPVSNLSGGRGAPSHFPSTLREEHAVIRGVHATLSEIEIKEELQQRGYSPLHIIRLKRGGGVPMPLVVVILPKIEKSQQLFNEHELLAEQVVEESRTCGKILTFLSWIVVVLTMPFSLLVCFKVS
ncbi:unnamed protein product, partial [Acanthoscelides obtectus]